MFLTRFPINPARRGARKLLASPQAMHAAVRAGFADPADYQRPDSRTLWRLDTPAPATVHLYLISPGRPDLTHLVEQAGWPTTATWDTRAYDPLLATLRPGQRWAFRLTANPVHSGRKTPDTKETQRFGYLRAEEQEQWLLQRAARCGFTVATQQDGRPNLRLHQRQTQSFKRGTQPVTLTTVTYDGVLDVTDGQAFRTALTSGIGHAKAYGCGLLTLAPADGAATGR
ncbi:type I-E CRISPR-associated protein Cas6/Cse3/CasE [Actinoplanes lobatus]|uniref:CRISPR system Cascade subunit CasE n=1 Tax=Actinoplanes lobatus TaxID=113568 RepID=A0A7W7HLQ2_9ACTN|nr:type I-E CRISPR-associated protein Cas6/Cse3/CasE [Actinoplanes lobatus]MBB4752527.1 CRISPR system Cascade subunit CasE [Actinoplanes lobatus]GGN93976.1 type I-E CRISPR-associated protein Cas6/Cse3/CasE [Actinoplanes lobatus]GIE44827.1 type I-E CRISPR-associated protein Cas6/Cse3/CasE [Actinoplanes lobatus]